MKCLFIIIYNSINGKIPIMPNVANIKIKFDKNKWDGVKWEINSMEANS